MQTQSQAAVCIASAATPEAALAPDQPTNGLLPLLLPAVLSDPVAVSPLVLCLTACRANTHALATSTLGSSHVYILTALACRRIDRHCAVAVFHVLCRCYPDLRIACTLSPLRPALYVERLLGLTKTRHRQS